MREICTVWGVVFYFVLSPLVECIIYMAKSLNRYPGAALEGPEQQGIRSINAQAPSKVPECNGGTVRRCMSVYLLFA